MNSRIPRLQSLALGTLLVLSTLSVACASDRSAPPKAKADAPKAAAPAEAAPAAAPVAVTAPAPAGDELIVLETAVGAITIDLFEDKTPGHAANFKKLVQQGYYDGSPFHRVIEGFMAQGGGKFGAGGQTIDVGYTVPAEIVEGLSHHRGAVAAARTSDQVNPLRASSGSQFYICLGDASFLDRQYSIFGEVVSGMENVDKITKGNQAANGVIDPAQATVIQRAYMKAKN